MASAGRPALTPTLSHSYLAGEGSTAFLLEQHGHAIHVPPQNLESHPGAARPVPSVLRWEPAGPLKQAQETGRHQPARGGHRPGGDRRRAGSRGYTRDPAAVALGHKGGLRGGKARAASLTPERRRARSLKRQPSSGGHRVNNRLP